MERISVGSVTTLWNNSTQGLTPTLQVIAVKRIQPAPGAEAGKTEKYRIVISDTVRYVSCMLATQHNELVTNGTVQQYGLIRLDEYVFNTVRGRTFMILLKFTVVSPPLEGGQVGNPTVLSDDEIAQGSGGPQRNPQQQQQAAAQSSYQGQQFQQQPHPQQPFQQKPQFQQQQQYQQQQQLHHSPTNAAEPSGITDIRMVTPYKTRFKIRVRCLSKSSRREWSKIDDSGNQRGGSVFSMELMDENGTGIEATAWNEAADTMFPIFEEQAVYEIWNMSVKLVDGGYKITLTTQTGVRKIPDDGKIKSMRFHMCLISDVARLVNRAKVDVMGVCLEVDGPRDINTRHGATRKTDVTLVDSSNAKIAVSLWGDKAEMVDNSVVGKVVAVTAATVGEFRGEKQLSSGGSTNIYVNPEMQEAVKVRHWFDSIPADQQLFSTLQGAASSSGGGPKRQYEQNWKTLAEGKQECVDWADKEKGYTFNTRATIIMFRKDNTNPWYTSCPSEGSCAKKVNMVNGNWRCEKCQEAFLECDYRYVLGMTVADHTSSQRLTAFNYVAETLLQCTAKELFIKRDAQQATKEYDQVFDNASFKQFNMVIRGQRQEFNGEDRLKHTLVKLEPLNYTMESSKLLQQIHAYDDNNNNN